MLKHWPSPCLDNPQIELNIPSRIILSKSQTITIGRAGNDINIDSPIVSRSHVRFMYHCESSHLDCSMLSETSSHYHHPLPATATSSDPSTFLSIPTTSFFTIEDCNSTNGVFLNSTKLFPLQPERLNDGDCIVLGEGYDLPSGSEKPILNSYLRFVYIQMERHLPHNKSGKRHGEFLDLTRQVISKLKQDYSSESSSVEVNQPQLLDLENGILQSETVIVDSSQKSPSLLSTSHPFFPFEDPEFRKSLKGSLPHQNVSTQTAHYTPPRIPESIEKDLICSICLGYLTEATSTLCGHIFCKKCIESWMKQCVECPLCRKDTMNFQVPNRLIDKLMSWFSLKNNDMEDDSTEEEDLD